MGAESQLAATGRGSPVRFLICDNDKKSPFAFENVLAAQGVPVIRTPLQAPVANCYAERWAGSVRRECLDWLIIGGQRPFERVLNKYVDHYNGARPHAGLRLHPPNGEVSELRPEGEITCRTRLGGLLREYARALRRLIRG